jgi:hypothetical protein
VQVDLTVALGGHALPRMLLADTGTGSQIAPFQLLLEEDDCLLCGGNPLQPIALGGAYTGSFPTYALRV